MKACWLFLLFISAQRLYNKCISPPLHMLTLLCLCLCREKFRFEKNEVSDFYKQLCKFEVTLLYTMLQITSALTLQCTIIFSVESCLFAYINCSHFTDCLWYAIFQACKLKLGDLKGALLDTEFAVRDGENNAKALFRQGQVGIPIEELSVTSQELLLPFNMSGFLLLVFNASPLSSVVTMLLPIDQAYMALHDIDAAVESFKKALTLEPNDGKI